MALAKIKKDDVVCVIAGKDKGRSGKVLRVFPKDSMCLVEKMNLVKRHQKARPTGGPAGIVEKPMKLALCKVALVDPKSKKPARTCAVVKGEKKVRQFVKSKELVDATK